MKDYSILVVDDSPENLRSIVEHLKKSEVNYTMLKAPNGKVACMLAEKRIPDLIIMDWEMPEMDGIEAIKYLKSNESTKDIPVIMCSGKMTSSENLKTALEAGAFDYIRKPIDVVELEARVYSAMNHTDALEDSKRKTEEARQMQQALTASEEKFRLLIEESSDPIFSFTPEGRYIYVNKVFAITAQKEQNFIIGKTIWDVFNKEQADTRFSVLKKVFETGEPFTFEVRVPNPAGDTYFITSVTPIKDNAGNVISAICISKNITSRKKMEQELTENKERLELQNDTLAQLNATKDKLFSLIAHDLKSPLSGLMGMTEMMYDQYDDINEDVIRNYLKIIRDGSKSTFDLLQNLLDWANSQTNMIAYEPENCLVCELVSENISLLENIANEKEISLETSSEEGLYVFADRNMILTVMRNLVSNAIKFTAKKGIISVHCKQIDKETVQVCIKDTGVGIPKDKIDDLFRIDKNTSTRGTENEAGTGLGLILCKEFVEKHGGKIWVESEEGKGSDIKFTIPVKDLQKKY